MNSCTLCNAIVRRLTLLLVVIVEVFVVVAAAATVVVLVTKFVIASIGIIATAIDIIMIALCCGGCY